MKKPNDDYRAFRVTPQLGQIETVSSDRAVSRLAAACRFRAVDQEYVSDSDILSLADRVLEQPDDGEEIIAFVKD